jgi:transposase
MVVTPELRTQILRLYLADQWRIGTIARQLHLHRDTVRRVLAVSSVLCATATVPPRLIDPFMPFIQETLTKFPTLAASRLYAMVQECGYGGGSSHFATWWHHCAPGPWLSRTCDCAPWPVNKAKRPLMAFVMVLSYSRRIFLHFSLNAQMDSFLRGHVLDFELLK